MPMRTSRTELIKLCPIYGSVSPALQSNIAGYTNPREMWVTLQNRMDIVQNEAGSTYMRRKFHNEIYGTSETLDQYIGRILSYQERLANTRQQLSDEDIIDQILSSLPTTYQVTKEMIFNQQDRTISSVIAALHRHAEIVHPTTGPPEPTSGATNTRGLYAGRKPYQRPNRQGRSQAQGQSQGQSQTQGKNTDTTCWYCGNTGRRQKECFLKQIVMKLRERGLGGKGKNNNGRGSGGGSNNAGNTQIHGNPDAAAPQHQVHFKRALVASAASKALAAIPSADTSDLWFVDSGATDHLSCDISMFHDVVYFASPVRIYMGDNRFIDATARGTVILSSVPSLRLYSVLYVPKLGSNLVSVGKLMKDGYSVSFGGIDNDCMIKDPQGGVILASYINGMFEISLLSPV